MVEFSSNLIRERREGEPLVNHPDAKLELFGAWAIVLASVVGLWCRR